MNSTAPFSVQAFGAYSHQVILRQFFNKPDLELDFAFVPFDMAKTNDPSDILAILKGIYQGLGIGFAYILISMSMISNIVKEKELNLKNQMRISGLSLPAYWIGHYISDVLFSMIITVAILILLAAYKA